MILRFTHAQIKRTCSHFSPFMRFSDLPKSQASSDRNNSDPYTHFFSLPLHTATFKSETASLMTNILDKVPRNVRSSFRKQNLDRVHVTLCMLKLTEEKCAKLKEIFNEQKEGEIKSLLQNEPLELTFENIGYFGNKTQDGKIIPRVIFTDIRKDEQFEKLNVLTHNLISTALENDILQKQDLSKMHIRFDRIQKMWRPKAYHVTLFRVRPHEHFSLLNFQEIFDEYKEYKIGSFTTNRLDISTRFQYDSDNFYKSLWTMNL